MCAVNRKFCNIETIVLDLTHSLLDVYVCYKYRTAAAAALALLWREALQVSEYNSTQ